MKHCKNCGAELHDDARFCSSCGAEQAKSGAQSVRPECQAEKHRGTLGLVLAVVALCVALLALAFALGLLGGQPGQSVTPGPGDTPVPSAVPTESPKPTDPAPSAPPTETPTATPDRTEALDELGVSAKGLTPEMARAYAALILAEQHEVVRAAIFDGGGVPMLWLAYGAAAEDYGDWEALDGPYGDQVYVFRDGEIEKCPWITTLLREGDETVIAQAWVDEVSDLQDDFRLYRMKNGRLEAEPFASGTVGINGATLNGQQVGGEDEYLTLKEVYKLVDPELEILLNADSGLADLLFLSGQKPWLEGETLAAALEAYAG